MDRNKALPDRAEIVAALQKECGDCVKRHWCDHGTNGIGLYCPNRDAAALIEAQAAQLASLTAERDAAVRDFNAVIKGGQENEQEH